MGSTARLSQEAATVGRDQIGEIVTNHSEKLKSINIKLDLVLLSKDPASDKPEKIKGLLEKKLQSLGYADKELSIDVSQELLPLPFGSRRLGKEQVMSKKGMSDKKRQ